MALRARVAEVRAEHLLTEMLVAQGWDARKPPVGDLLRQQEYKDHPALAEMLKGKGKQGGGGDGLPEGILVDRLTLQPLVVIEAKPTGDNLAAAEKDVLHYGRACVDAGYAPLLVALAGSNEDDFQLRVFKWTGAKWVYVTYDKTPIAWIPNRDDVGRLLPIGASSEMRPSIPPPEVLAERADEINRLLREAGIRDALRPGVVGAIMLALWQSQGNIRKDPKYILGDINKASQQAFWDAKKAELQKSLRVDEANDDLAIKARRIVSILERLNVHVLTAAHDYLGQLYETFFRYTGGNTIGQYFTPRHIADFMAELCEVGPKDVVLDVSCGTGGFLIAAMNRIVVQKNLSRAQLGKIVKERLIGIDKEPITAAICVANMILRGDGSTSVHREDCFTWKEYPKGKASVALLNPPFPHAHTDRPPEDFVDRALEGLQPNGQVAVIVPTSLLVKGSKKQWRTSILKRNTLEAVIGLPDELFQPYASSYTTVLLIRKGLPHAANRHVFFARITNDGLRIKKRVRVPREGEQITSILKSYRKHVSVPGLCGWSPLADIWGPGVYVPSRRLDADEVLEAATVLARERAAFVVRHAPDLTAFQAYVEAEKLPLKAPAGRDFPAEPGTVGAYFKIGYGQRSLHSKERLVAGPSLVVSASGNDNGCYGFFDFDDLLQPPFVTVPSTGSYGEARIQEWPCGVTDDCLLLTPKDGTPPELLYVAAAVIRNERWRFNYGMKVTPARIAAYPLNTDAELLARVRDALDQLGRVDDLALNADAVDHGIALERLRDVAQHPEKVIRGKALTERLEALI